MNQGNLPNPSESEGDIKRRIRFVLVEITNLIVEIASNAEHVTKECMSDTCLDAYSLMNDARKVPNAFIQNVTVFRHSQTVKRTFNLMLTFELRFNVTFASLFLPKVYRCKLFLKELLRNFIYFLIKSD